MNTVVKLNALFEASRNLWREFWGLSLADPGFEDKRDVVWKRMDEVIAEAAAACRILDPESVRWFTSALSQPESSEGGDLRSFAISVLGKVPEVPRELALFALRLGIETPDPSSNRWFIGPAIRGLGAYEVCQRLLEVMRNGMNYEKAGALNALHWAASDAFLREEGCSFKEGVSNDSPECRALRRQIFDEMSHLSLLEFVSNEDLDVRRSFVRWISADETRYPKELCSKVREAVQIALHHPDEFIRLHMQRQLNPDGLIAPLPARQRPQS